MRCPKCGFVSFPGLSACKKCGYPFGRVANQKGPPLEFVPRLEARPSFQAQLDSEPRSVTSMNEIAAGTLAGASSPREPAAPQRNPQVQADGTSASALPGGLSERVASFRRRKAREIREMSLPLEFDSPRGGPQQSETFLERAFEDRSARSRALTPQASPIGPSLAREPGKSAVIASASLGTSVPGGEAAQQEWASTPLSLDAEYGYGEIATAPLKKRFLAGLIDTFALMVAAGVFTAVFRLAGGRIEPGYMDFGALLFIAAFWIFAYFGAFTLLAFDTPGQAALKLTVRNLDGDAPTWQEALLRGFGYVISVATLMLGFLWAAMDSDGMAWHDHISGTILIEQE